ncbi:hypothetical protein LAZ40_07040 [Cereibacter sphaeroides]|uniref:calcium-binding protein n=1 Tax=Cereibacter sphaeroides TaxID=1063 RepID=UPI001F288D5F|nr:calcium-binding protein [Cereibacter sphaeroides]MCE6958803.1 hypothetical protein [Cereibacter sphaeroides]MCE6973323.1 hypothetical protein [Cereibacter sphaeroides]
MTLTQTASIRRFHQEGSPDHHGLTGSHRESHGRRPAEADAWHTKVFLDVMRGTPGDDVIETSREAAPSVRLWHNAWLSGAAGDDYLIATNRVASHETVLLSRWLDGGPGSDQLTVEVATMTDASLGRIHDRIRMDGGQGNDGLRYFSDLCWTTSGGTVTGPVRIDLRQQGGVGDDLMVAFHGIGSGVGGEIITRLDGGSGDDFLNAAVHALPGSDADLRICSTVRGGAGDDTIQTGLYNVDGRCLLLGGTGNDQITAVGGHARLVGGDGDDILISVRGVGVATGGSGRDTFVIEPLAEHLIPGSETVLYIADFDRNEDSLHISYEFPFGDATLEHVLATTTVVDEGLGRDVIVHFDSGYRLIFANAGTGDSRSILDVVDSFIFS